MADGYEMKDNTFALFKNEKKENDKHPDYTGDIMVNGKKLRLSAWINETKAGKKYMKGSISEPYNGEKSKKAEDDF